MNASYGMNFENYKKLGLLKLKERAKIIRDNKDFCKKVSEVLDSDVRDKQDFESQEEIYAEEAKRLGIVSEVLPRERLGERAKELAASLATHDHIFLRHTRSVLVQKLRKQVADMLPLGLHAEYASALADTALPRPDGVDWRDA